MTSTLELMQVCDAVWEVFDESSDPQIKLALHLLYERMERPQSFVSVVGETSSGKSTLINSLLGSRLLPAAAGPTTGTVTWITLDADPLPEEVPGPIYTAIYRDATKRTLSAQEFIKLSTYPERDLLRLKLQLASPSEEMVGSNLFDTPGFNSLVSEHSEVLKEFLPESDVIVFCVSYRVGFGTEDAELMGLVAESGDRFGQSPVILVINRCADGATLGDKRITEIQRYAEDSLHRPVTIILVSAQIPGINGVSDLPKAENLWAAVARVCHSKDRTKAVLTRLTEMLMNLLRERISEIETLTSAMNSGPSEAEALRDIFRDLEETEKQALLIVAKYMERLRGGLPRFVKYRAGELALLVTQEIDSANRWVDASSCAAYIRGHTIPFGVKRIAQEVERQVEMTFEEMDQELNELANQVVHRIERSADLTQSPDLAKILRNTALRTAMRLGGDAAGSLAKGLGGVGGAAAGAGNFVKMGVKKLGELVGHTFSREVYQTIGRVFTKKFLERVNVAVQVIVEGVTFLVDAHTWQSKLKSDAETSIGKWADETVREIGGVMISEYETSNRDLVASIFNEQRADLERSIREIESEVDQDRLDRNRGWSETLRRHLHLLEDEYGKA